MTSKSLTRNLFTFVLMILALSAFGEDGYRLWLRYDAIEDATVRRGYAAQLKYFVNEKTSPTLDVANKELTLALSGLLTQDFQTNKTLAESGAIVLGTPVSSPLIASLKLQDRLKSLGDEGFLLFATTLKGKKCIVITGIKDTGVLYGAFHFIKLLLYCLPLPPV